MANKDTLLSVAEFEDRQNNFYLHFVGEVGKHWMGDHYRSQSAYVACMTALPSEFGSLAARLRSFYTARGRGLSEHPWNGLYEAYQKMHQFAEDNNELFR